MLLTWGRGEDRAVIVERVVVVMVSAVMKERVMAGMGMVEQERVAAGMAGMVLV